jgi:hypothetical protein
VSACPTELILQDLTVQMHDFFAALISQWRGALNEVAVAAFVQRSSFTSYYYATILSNFTVLDVTFLGLG